VSLRARARAASDRKDYERCAQLSTAATRQGARDANAYYNAACCYALAGKREEAFRHLEESIVREFVGVGVQPRKLVRPTVAFLSDRICL
jgi:thioredoxin-like negative regulator of GroEL